MHAHSNENDDTDPRPRFFVWCYPSGLMTVAVEGSDNDDVDGETLLSWHEYAGVEIGPSSIIAASGDAIVLVFNGSYQEQKTFFDEWDRQARENDRPNVFLNEGIEGLVQRGTTATPPLPDINVWETEQANKLLSRARERMREEAERGDLTLEDCMGIVDEVDE
jgi:hypothetical protein